MSASTLREVYLLLGVSLLLGLTYNAITEKGIFGPTDNPVRSSSTGVPLPSSELISLEQAKELYDASDALFIDTRHAYDFELEHIPGAVNIPLKGADEAVSHFQEPKDRTLVVYCDGAECNSSLEVGSMFIMEGYSDVRIFFSGWKTWKAGGYATEGPKP